MLGDGILEEFFFAIVVLGIVSNQLSIYLDDL